MSARPDLATGGWIAEHAELARTLWDDGVLASEIARRVGHGATKNSIVGYAHRHAWPPRPSPIAINGVRPDAPAPRQPYKPKQARKAALAKPRKPPAARPLPAPAPAAPPPEQVATRGCAWTDSDGRPWVFCGKPVKPGSAYCSEHHLRAYNRAPRMGMAA